MPWPPRRWWRKAREACLSDPRIDAAEAYRDAYAAWSAESAGLDADADATWLDRELLPDPAKARVRVYVTQSTHKTLTSLRQGSMIHVWDQDFKDKAEEAFHEAYMTHTSTSPNYQILASLDVGRRQVELEGYELVQRQLELAMTLREQVLNHPLLKKYFRFLRVGDLVVTRDHGLQPIRWIQQRTVPALESFAPIRIRPGVITGQDRDLLVSPQHRMLFQGYRAELLFGESEVLVSAKHMINDKYVTQETGGDVTYIHMMFDEHEVVYAEGAATESFHPGDVGLTAVSDPAREELFALFPALRSNVNGYGQTARRCLKGHETKLLIV